MVFKKLPVDIHALTKSQAGKTVKSLIKISAAGPEVQGAAKELVLLWKKMFISKEGKEAAAPLAGKRER